jgi:hypothetical protein
MLKLLSKYQLKCVISCITSWWEGYCTVSIVLCLLCCVYCTVSIVLCLLCCVYCAVCIVLCLLCCVYCTLSTVLCLLCCVYCVVYCTVSIVLCLFNLKFSVQPDTGLLTLYRLFSVVYSVFCTVLWHCTALCYCFSSVYCTVHCSCTVLCLLVMYCCYHNWGFSVLFPQFKANANGKDGARPAIPKLVFIFFYLCMFLIFYCYVWSVLSNLCTVCV